MRAKDRHFSESVLENFIKNFSFAMLSRKVDLYEGLAGVLLYASLNQHWRPHKKLAEIQSALLWETIQRCRGEIPGPSLLGGFSGVYWTLNFLENYLGKGSVTKPLRPQWEYLKKAALSGDMLSDDLDVVNGLAGLGLAMISVGGKGSRQVTEKLVNLFWEQKRETENGFYWPHRDRLKLGVEVDTGLAHGLAGFLIFLTQAYRLTKQDKAKKMMAGICLYLWNLDTEQGYTTLPSQLPVRNVLPRSAWCYGDLAVGHALQMAARTLRNKELNEWACFVAERGLREKPYRKVTDSFICHGYSGQWLLAKNNKALSEKQKAELYNKFLRLSIRTKKSTPETGLMNSVLGAGLAFDPMNSEKYPWTQFLGIF